MYRTARPCRPAGRLHGEHGRLDAADPRGPRRRCRARSPAAIPAVHGAPVHVGDPARSASPISPRPSSATRRRCETARCRCSGPAASPRRPRSWPRGRRSPSPMRPGHMFITDVPDAEYLAEARPHRIGSGAAGRGGRPRRGDAAARCASWPHAPTASSSWCPPPARCSSASIRRWSRRRRARDGAAARGRGRATAICRDRRSVTIAGALRRRRTSTRWPTCSASASTRSSRATAAATWTRRLHRLRARLRLPRRRRPAVRRAAPLLAAHAHPGRLRRRSPVRFSGVYPRESPGGWQLIGRTDAPMWDLHRDPPALLAPGDDRAVRAASSASSVTATDARVARSTPGRTPPIASRGRAPRPAAAARGPRSPGHRGARRLRVRSGRPPRPARREPRRRQRAGSGRSRARRRRCGPALHRPRGRRRHGRPRRRTTIVRADGPPLSVEHGAPSRSRTATSCALGAVRAGLRYVIAVRGGLDRSAGARQPLDRHARAGLGDLGGGLCAQATSFRCADPRAAPRAVDPNPAPADPLPAPGDTVELRIVLGPRDGLVHRRPALAPSSSRSGPSRPAPTGSASASRAPSPLERVRSAASCRARGR